MNIAELKMEMVEIISQTYDEPTVNVRVPMPMGRTDPSLGSSSVDGQQSFALRTKYIVGGLVFEGRF